MAASIATTTPCAPASNPTTFRRDCPELDHRIGALRLPMLEWYREEPVLVTLPQNYQGQQQRQGQLTGQR